LVRRKSDDEIEKYERGREKREFGNEGTGKGYRLITTEYVIPLGEQARKRHYHETEKGRVIHFTVKLEVLVNKEWRVVIRYDSAHGFAHIDRYYLDGRRVKKEINLKLREALTLADEDIKENWKGYQEEFLEGK